MSELINSNVTNINSVIKSEKESGTARIPSSDSRSNNESLNAESIDGLRPSCRENNIPVLRGVARLSPSSMVGRGGTILSVSKDTVGRLPGHLELNSTNACEVTRKRSLDKGVQFNNPSSDVGLDINLIIEPIQAEECGDRDIPASKRRVISTSQQEEHEVSKPSQSDSDEQVHTLVNGITGNVQGTIRLTAIPPLPGLLELDEMSLDECGQALKAGDLSELVVLRPIVELNSSSLLDEAVLEETKTALSARSGSAILKNPMDPFYSLVKEFQDVVCTNPPSVLPPDRGVRHEIDLVPGTKYCVTRQWPLPQEQCDVIDDFFRAKHKAGMVRESKSPHSTPTFCVKKSSGKWRIVHAYNKLNAATIPAQTPIPRKDVLQNNMAGCTIYSALDLVDGYYQLLMRADDIPLTAVSTPSGMLWEWLVMPQGLSNAPATFNRLVTQLFRPHRGYAQTYFDDVFVHSRADQGRSEVDNHIDHLRAVLECMRTHKLYANASKCIFGAEEIPFLGCFIGKRGLRADPAKVKAIVDWPVLRSQKKAALVAEPRQLIAYI